MSSSKNGLMKIMRKMKKCLLKRLKKKEAILLRIEERKRKRKTLSEK